MTNNTTTRAPLLWADNLTPEQARELAHQAANTAIKARPRTAFIEQLLTYGRAERHHNPEQMAELLAAYEDEHESAAEQAAEAWNAAEELATDPDTAALWSEEANEQTNRRNAARDNAEDTRRALFDRISTDFTDIRAAALVQYYNTITNPASVAEHMRDSVGPAQPTAALLAQYGAESLEELDEETAAEVQARANYKSMIAAAGQALNACRALDGMDGHHTDTRPADPATVAEWVAAYGGTGKDYRRELPRGQYQTVEHLESTKRRPSGWYIVTHRRTVKAAQSLDQLTAEGWTTAAPDNSRREEAAANRAEYLAAIIKAAKLTPRAAEWVAAYTSDTAQARAAAAMDEYAATVRKWNAERRAALRNAGHMAARAYADSAAGYNSPQAAANAYKRIVDRLAAAAERVKLTDTGRDKLTDRQTRAHVRAAFANRAAIRYTDTARADLLQWLTGDTDTTAAPVIKWTRKAHATGNSAQADTAPARPTPTPAEIARIEYRRRLDTAARFEFDRQTPAEQAERVQAADKARRAAERAAAVAAVRAKYPTAEEWHKMSRAERDQWAATH